MSDIGVLLNTIAGHTPGVTEVIRGGASVSEITHDSRQVEPGSMFAAIRGEHFDGHDFVQSAIDRGATALLVEEKHPNSIPQIVVADTREALAWAARTVFGEPDSSLVIAGVTGTNGKTTVTHMVEAIMHAADVPVGIIGTLGARINGVALPIARTTPEASDLQRILGAMRNDGVGVVLVEVSSHAIQLRRTDAIRFSVMGFTNLTQDHLDFHGDMETYFAVKQRAFEPQYTNAAVVNVDDPWGARLTDRIGVPAMTVSIGGESALSATDVVATSTGTSFVVSTPMGLVSVDLPIPGRFNVSNALVAVGIASTLDIAPTAISAGLRGLKPIPGRMEVVPHDGPFTAVVDYAHTPDAISAVLSSARSVASGRVIVIFGAGGDRDVQKRSLMGAAAARISDLAIITTDNPRSENPEEIAAEISQGAEAQCHAEVETVIDRRAAIKLGIAAAQPGDIVLVLGKGHEQSQDVGSEVLPFDDRQEVATALRDIGWTPL